jgi:hypothetical protein
MTTFAQTASVKGVTLTYNNKTKTMYCVKESNFVYKFSNVKPGEYIVVVTKRCDEKYVIEKSNTSLIVR